MGKFELEAASGRCRYVPESRAGLVQMNYYGVIDAEALIRVRDGTIKFVAKSPALVIRTDTALVTLDEVPMVTWRPGRIPPAAIIVRPELRELWVEYARQMAEVGITRAVFLESQAEQAYRWAEHLAEQAALLSRLGRLDRR